MHKRTKIIVIVKNGTFKQNLLSTWFFFPQRVNWIVPEPRAVVNHGCSRICWLTAWCCTGHQSSPGRTEISLPTVGTGSCVLYSVSQEKFLEWGKFCKTMRWLDIHWQVIATSNHTGKVVLVKNQVHKQLV